MSHVNLANGVSGMHKDELILRWPKGGLGILWKKSMMDTVEFKSILPNSNRVCAIVINCGNDSVLCINIYMPVDNQKKTHVDPEFIETLEAVDIYIKQCNFRNVVKKDLMNPITFHKLPVLSCNYIIVSSTLNSQMSSMLIFVWPFWTFKLVQGQAVLWTW